MSDQKRFKLISQCNGQVVLLAEEIGEQNGEPVLAIFPALCVNQKAERAYVEDATGFIRLQQSRADSREDRVRMGYWCMGYQDGFTQHVTGHRFGEISRADIDTDYFRARKTA